VVGDLIGEAGYLDAVDGVYCDDVLDAGHVQACAVALDHYLVGNTTDPHLAVIARKGLVLVDPVGAEFATGRW